MGGLSRPRTRPGSAPGIHGRRPRVLDGGVGQWAAKSRTFAARRNAHMIIIGLDAADQVPRDRRLLPTRTSGENRLRIDTRR